MIYAAIPSPLRVEVVDIYVGKPVFLTRLEPGLFNSFPHTIILVKRLSVDETWVIDPVGSRYGFKETLAPLDRYLKDHECTYANEPRIYDDGVMMELNHFATVRAMNETETQRQRLANERKARRCFQIFVNACLIYGSGLNGSKTNFEDELCGFELILRAHLEELFRREIVKR